METRCTARYDEDDPPLKKIDGCRRVAPGAVVLMLTTVVGVFITDTRRPERVASGYNVCARQEQFGVLFTLVPWFTLRHRCRLEDMMKILRRRGDEDDTRCYVDDDDADVEILRRVDVRILRRRCRDSDPMTTMFTR